MKEGEVITLIASLVGLFLTIGMPIIKLNTTITKLISRVDAMEDIQKRNERDIQELDDKSHESHKRIHDRIDKLDARVTVLENNKN